MPNAVTAAAVGSFYKAAATGLRFLERRASGRRVFGPDADARWQGFAGHLRTADRLDLGLRDGAVSWGAAFSAAAVFQLAGLALDEPFGPDWPGLAEDDARRVWREAEAFEPSGWEKALESVVAQWGLQPSSISLDKITPATRLVVSGASAVSCVARVFAAADSLSWADQVAVVSSTPAVRHLAGLAAVLIEARGPTRIVSPDDAVQAGLSPAALLREAGLTAVDRAVISDDAESGDADFARAACDAGRG